MNDVFFRTSQAIHVDVTELVVFELRTGIQRVVRELVHHGRDGATEASIVPVIAIGSRFYELNDAGWASMISAGRGAGERNITHQRGVPALVRLGKKAVTFSPRLYNFLQRLYVRRITRKRSQGLYDPRPVPFAQGNTLVLLDSFWGGSSTLAAARRAKSAGARIVLVAYDLIPISHPQYCDARLVQKFRALMAQAAALSDQVLAISQFCADSFKAEFPTTNVQAFPLGHDLRVGDGGGPRSDWPNGLWRGSDPVFLIVGSIEPRKGHETVLDAFERAWARGAAYKLLIIGKVGWQVDVLMDRLDAHAEAGRKLFVIHHASDAMLADALARADAAIIASYIEGFGLPLAEALAAGLPVIASDIPVFREIAGDLACYFQPGDPGRLDAAIGEVAADLPAKRELTDRFRWPDWHGSAEIFFRLVAGTATDAPSPVRGAPPKLKRSTIVDRAR